MKWCVLVVGIGAAIALSCGSSDDDDDDDDRIEGDPIDCEWLANENCWKTTLATAPGCLPPADEEGTLSADGRLCTYPSGDVVSFAEPLLLPTDFDKEWNFRITTSTGSECLSFRSTETGKTLTVLGQSYVEQGKGLGVGITCPDGHKYASQNAFDLLECDNFFEDASSSATFESGSSISFAFAGLGGSSLTAWRCKLPGTP